MLPIALRTLATRSHASIATSSRVLLKARPPRASIQRLSSATFSSRAASPLAPEEETEEHDEHDEHATEAPLTHHQKEEMPKSRGEHLPVDWAFYQSVVGQPVVNTYHALRTVGYDAPWELFLRYCDTSGSKIKAVLNAMDGNGENNFRARIKAALKGSEALYINDCWKVLMQRRRAEQGVEIGEGDMPSVEGFTGGTWREWNTMRLKGRDYDDGKIKIKEAKKKVAPPSAITTDKRVSTLRPPVKNELNRWFLVIRPPSAKASESAEAEAEAEDADGPSASSSKRSSIHRIQLHRTIRLPSLPEDTSIGQARIYFNRIDWSDPTVDVKEVTIMWDQDAQELQLIERVPGSDGTQWKLAANPVTLEALTNFHYIDPLMELVKDQGMLDVPKWEQLCKTAKLKLGLETLDLAPNHAQGVKLETYPMRSAGQAGTEFRLRVYFAPTSKPNPTSTTTTDELSKVPPKSLSQQFHTTLFPTHAPHLFEARMAGHVQRRNRNLEAVLSRNDPLDPPEIKPDQWTEGGGIEILPYISTFGATRGEHGGWEVDISTPNRDPSPPTRASLEGAVGESTGAGAPTISAAATPTATETALTYPSASPESLRFWCYALNQDVAFNPRPHLWRLGYYVAFTGEQVKEKLPVVWAWAKERGYWKEIPE
ncbi:hypothetical protein FRB90_005738 [Tulasnella sp. 427]|nr:hypothetical protein FRB90_005738 [Tulasnella sp. 427]